MVSSISSYNKYFNDSFQIKKEVLPKSQSVDQKSLKLKGKKKFTVRSMISLGTLALLAGIVAKKAFLFLSIQMSQSERAFRDENSTPLLYFSNLKDPALSQKLEKDGDLTFFNKASRVSSLEAFTLIMPITLSKNSIASFNSSSSNEMCDAKVSLPQLNQTAQLATVGSNNKVSGENLVSLSTRYFNYLPTLETFLNHPISTAGWTSLGCALGGLAHQLSTIGKVEIVAAKIVSLFNTHESEFERYMNNQAPLPVYPEIQDVMRIANINRDTAYTISSLWAQNLLLRPRPSLSPLVSRELSRRRVQALLWAAGIGTLTGGVAGAILGLAPAVIYWFHLKNLSK